MNVKSICKSSPECPFGVISPIIPPPLFTKDTPLEPRSENSVSATAPPSNHDSIAFQRLFEEYTATPFIKTELSSPHAGSCITVVFAYNVPSLSSEVIAGETACSSPNPTLGSEGLLSRNNPSKDGSAKTGFVQNVGKKNVAGPLKLVELRNSVQH